MVFGVSTHNVNVDGRGAAGELRRSLTRASPQLDPSVRSVAYPLVLLDDVNIIIISSSHYQHILFILPYRHLNSMHPFALLNILVYFCVRHHPLHNTIHMYSYLHCTICVTRNTKYYTICIIHCKIQNLTYQAKRGSAITGRKTDITILPNSL